MKKTNKKFKSGDWIVHEFGKDCTEIFQVTGIEEGKYILNIGSWEIRKCNRFARYWKIEDAKPGDILATESGKICIFKDIDKDCILTYFILYISGEIRINEELVLIDGDGIKPATRTQKIAILETIEDLGYEWNSELLKIKKTRRYWIKKIKNFWKK